MNHRIRPSRPVRRLLRTTLLLVTMTLCAWPAVAANYTIRPGDTLPGVARKFGIAPKTLAARNGLKAREPLRPGTTLTVPDAKASPQARASTKPSPEPPEAAKASQKAPAAIVPAPVLGPDARALLNAPLSSGGNSGVNSGAKGLTAAPPAPAAERPGKFAISPVMRPAIDLLTPDSPIGRAPKDFNASTPGLKATLHTGKDTGITGVVNAPAALQGSSKSLPVLERDAPAGTSAGVLLQKTF